MKKVLFMLPFCFMISACHHEHKVSEQTFQVDTSKNIVVEKTEDVEPPVGDNIDIIQDNKGGCDYIETVHGIVLRKGVNGC
jgi:hypothetical protein